MSRRPRYCKEKELSKTVILKYGLRPKYGLYGLPLLGNWNCCKVIFVWKLQYWYSSNPSCMDQFYVANFSKFCRPIRQVSRLITANFSNSVAS